MSASGTAYADRHPARISGDRLEIGMSVRAGGSWIRRQEAPLMSHPKAGATKRIKYFPRGRRSGSNPVFSLDSQARNLLEPVLHICVFGPAIRLADHLLKADRA